MFSLSNKRFIFIQTAAHSVRTIRWHVHFELTVKIAKFYPFSVFLVKFSIHWPMLHRQNMSHVSTSLYFKGHSNCPLKYYLVDTWLMFLAVEHEPVVWELNKKNGKGLKFCDLEPINKMILLVNENVICHIFATCYL